MVKYKRMRLIALIVMATCLSLTSKAQEVKIYQANQVTVKAAYKNGTGDIMTYVSSNFKQPFMCILDKVKTTFRIRFVVNEDGSLSNVTVIGCDVEGSCCQDMNAACEDLLKEMNGWKPAEVKGELVKQWVEIPMNVNNAG